MEIRVVKTSISFTMTDLITNLPKAMKKLNTSLLLAVFCSIAFSCTNIMETESVNPEVTVEDGFTQVITGRLDESNSRANITNAGAFTWTAAKDIVAVHVSDEAEGISRYVASEGASASAETADFAVTTSTESTIRDAFAVYPSCLVDCSSSTGPANYGQSGAPLDLTLPGTYSLADVAGVHTPVAMIADNSGDTWSFKHIGAVLKLILNNVPGNTAKIGICMPGQKIWGDFSLSSPVTPGTSQLETAEDADHDTVMITDLSFNPNTPFYDGVRISIPLPTGTYPNLSVFCYDSEDTVIKEQQNHPVNYTLPRRGGALLTITFGGVTVNAAGDQVVFAPGNLQALISGNHPIDADGYVKAVSQWRFAPHQYDVLESANTFEPNTWVDLFTWQGESSPMGNMTPNYGVCTYYNADDVKNPPADYFTKKLLGEGLASDWGNLPIDNYAPGTWRTPAFSAENPEWEYILNTRNASTVATNTGSIENARFIKAYINSSIRCLIIFPDYYSHPDGIPQVYNNAVNNAEAKVWSNMSLTGEEWAKMEAAGATVLPLGGYRTGTTFKNGNTGSSNEARYCSSSGSTGAGHLYYYLGFSKTKITIGEDLDSHYKCVGASVRLVRDIRSGKTDKTLDTAPAVTGTGSIFGLVSCKGKGVPGVVVSDGVLTTQTDADGVYSLNSSKSSGYVFISTPSGYIAPTFGIVPTIHKLTRFPAATAERIDFDLLPDGDQANHTILVMGDMHLANRYNDIAGFQRFTDDVNAFKAANPGKKIYVLTLGDMTWDLYWLPDSQTGNTYGIGAGVGFKEYLKLTGDRIQGIPFYHTIGNHDHSMYYAGDVNTVTDYTQNVAPTYYSFNIGNVHYIVLDDILCTNNGSGSRSHNVTLTSDQLTWLQNDLSYVPETTPLVVATHAPLYKENGSANLTNASTLINILSAYPEVHVFSGHTHKMYNVDNRASDHIFEHNAGSVCGTWWWTHYCTRNGSKIIVGPDGSPGGYTILDVADKTFEWQYKAVGKDIAHQFRTYDRNQVELTKANFYPDCTDAEKDAIVDDAAQYWNSASSANEVYLNIWNWDPSWTISVTEGGTPLTLTKVTRKDPLQTISYLTIRANANKAVNFPAENSGHFWKVTASGPSSTLTITVTDGFGNTYTETMTRPKAFDLETYSYAE